MTKTSPQEIRDRMKRSKYTVSGHPVRFIAAFQNPNAKRDKRGRFVEGTRFFSIRELISFEAVNPGTPSMRVWFRSEPEPWFVASRDLTLFGLETVLHFDDDTPL